VQDEIAASVVSGLRIKLIDSTPKTRATNPEAYALFLQAREVRRQYTKAAFEQSIVLYQRAVGLDPSYAEAWDGLAGVYCFQVNEGLQSPSEGMRLARAATEKSLAFDPQYAPAHARLGWIAIYYDRDLAAAANHLKQALTLEPTNPEVIGTAAILARRLGRLEEAVEIGRYQIARDPVNADSHFDLALAYFYMDRFDAAISEYRTVLTLSPRYIGAHSWMAEALVKKGDVVTALKEAEQEEEEGPRLRHGPRAARRDQVRREGA